jgi:hypothetical protein
MADFNEYEVLHLYFTQKKLVYIQTELSAGYIQA